VDERVGVQVKLWNPLITRAIPERFCGGDSLWRGAISSECTFTFTFTFTLLSYDWSLNVACETACDGQHTAYRYSAFWFGRNDHNGVSEVLRGENLSPKLLQLLIVCDLPLLWTA